MGNNNWLDGLIEDFNSKLKSLKIDSPDNRFHEAALYIMANGTGNPEKAFSNTYTEANSLKVFIQCWQDLLELEHILKYGVIISDEYTSENFEKMIKGDFIWDNENTDKMGNLPRNTQFEFKKLADLRSAGLDAHFGGDNPDIICIINGRHYGIEAKRIFSHKKDTASKRIRDAAKQLNKRHIKDESSRGIIWIKIDHHYEDFGEILLELTHQIAQQRLLKKVRNFADQHSNEFKEINFMKNKQNVAVFIESSSVSLTSIAYKPNFIESTIGLPIIINGKVIEEYMSQFQVDIHNPISKLAEANNAKLSSDMPTEPFVFFNYESLKNCSQRISFETKSEAKNYLSKLKNKPFDPTQVNSFNLASKCKLCSKWHLS